MEYAREHKALLLFDAAYEGYISDPEIPHSIYEIAGRARSARSSSAASPRTADSPACAAVSRSCRKTLKAQTADGRSLPLHPLWHRRWSTKSNSVSYPVQRGAEALYSDEGKAQVRALVEHYMGNARILREAAERGGTRSLRWGERALHLGADAGWPNELANVRPDAATIATS